MESKSREAFEEAASLKLKVDKSWIKQERDGDHYKSRWDSMSILQPLSDWWHWWQASRKSLVVELPPASDDDLVEFKEECASAILAAGITVKGDS